MFLESGGGKIAIKRKIERKKIKERKKDTRKEGRRGMRKDEKICANEIGEMKY